MVEAADQVEAKPLGAPLLALTVATMVAFAGNSLLCRAALASEAIGPISFTMLRVCAGASVLGVLMLVKPRDPDAGGAKDSRASWRGAFALMVYALCFSVAYLSLDAGSGALILFAAVQLTMMGANLFEGERPSLRVWAGSVIAIAGLIALLWPGVSAPDPIGALLMSLAGIGWGLYSLFGRGALRPIAMTAGNFLRAAPLALLAFVVAVWAVKAESVSAWERQGVWLALASGGVTSGLGYALWYRALRDLRTMTAAVAQLSVPVIAAIGGALWLGESLTTRLMAASAVTLLGIALVSTASTPNAR